MKKVILFLTLILVAIVTSSCLSQHDKRMSRIYELQYEALDGDTAKLATTQTAIDSILKRVDKEYSITDDHDTRMDLIEERRELERADFYNDIKRIEVELSRLEDQLNERLREIRLHEDPGRTASSSNDDSTRYTDLPIDPGRKS